MDWIQTFTIIGVLGGFIIFMLNKVDNDIKSVEGKIELAYRRMDQLYGVIIEMLKKY